ILEHRVGRAIASIRVFPIEDRARIVGLVERSVTRLKRPLRGLHRGFVGRGVTSRVVLGSVVARVSNGRLRDSGVRSADCYSAERGRDGPYSGFLHHISRTYTARSTTAYHSRTGPLTTRIAPDLDSAADLHAGRPRGTP